MTFMEDLEDRYPPEFLAEVLGAMRQATQELLDYLGLWEVKKADPSMPLTLRRRPRS
jgi:hypothetical protein